MVDLSINSTRWGLSEVDRFTSNAVPLSRTTESVSTTSSFNEWWWARGIAYFLE